MRIITLWHARLTVFVILSFFMVPLIFAFSYLFEAVVQVPPLVLLWIALMLTGILIIVSALILILFYKSWTQIIDSAYRKEYALVFLVTWLGIVGIFVLLNSFFQVTEYFFLIMIPLVVLAYYGLAKIGTLVFNVPLFLGTKDGLE